VANTFDWVEIRTKDVAKAADFNQKLFGWKVVAKETSDGLDVWIFDTGDMPRLENLRRGGLWLRPAGEKAGVVVYIVVEDIEAILEKATALGGQVVVPKTSQGPAFRACFADLDGNVFGLWEEEAPD